MDRDPGHRVLTRSGSENANRSPTNVYLKVVYGRLTEGRVRSNLNAHAERFVRSIRSECLSKVVPLGERHLRILVREYLEHCHLERNHQGLSNELIDRQPKRASGAGEVGCHERLGGMLRYYHEAAA